MVEAVDAAEGRMPLRAAFDELVAQTDQRGPFAIRMRAYG